MNDEKTVVEDVDSGLVEHGTCSQCIYFHAYTKENLMGKPTPEECRKQAHKRAEERWQLAKDIQKSLANGKSIAEIAEKEGLTFKEVCKLSSQKRMATVLDSSYPDGYCKRKQTYKCLNNGCQSFKQK